MKFNSLYFGIGILDRYKCYSFSIKFRYEYTLKHHVTEIRVWTFIIGDFANK